MIGPGGKLAVGVSCILHTSLQSSCLILELEGKVNMSVPTGFVAVEGGEMGEAGLAIIILVLVSNEIMEGSKCVRCCPGLDPPVKILNYSGVEKNFLNYEAKCCFLLPLKL